MTQLTQRLLLMVFLTILANVAFAQFDSFNYQGKARDNNGAVLANQNIALRISILDGSTSGVSEYIETHNMTTNQFGLFSTKVGNGVPVSGSFSNITWATNPKFMKVEIDVTGGTSFTFVATNELLTVPYAIYALNASNGGITYVSGSGITINGSTISALDDSPTNEFQDLTITSHLLSLTNSTTTVDLSPYLDNTDNQGLLLSNNLLGISNNSTTIDLSSYLDNTDNQQLSIFNGVISLTNGGSVTLPSLNYQNLSLIGNTLGISNSSTTIDLSNYLDNTDNQNLSLIGNTLGISNSSTTIDLGSYLDNTDNQSLSFSNNILGLSNSSMTIDFSSFLDNTDNQQLSLSNGVISLTNGGSVTLPSSSGGYQNLSFSNNILGLSNSSATIDFSSFLDNTDNQQLSLSNGVISLTNGGSVTLPTYTAGQNISINSSGVISNTAPDQVVTLSGGTDINVIGTYPNYTINSTASGGTTYTQGTGIGISGSTITNTAPDKTVSITGQGATTVTGSYPNFTITSTDNVNDADASPTNEIQTLSISGNNISISNGNTIALPASNSIVVVNATNLTSVTVANNDIIKIDGTITLSSNYTNLDYDGLNINNGTISGTGTQEIEIGQEVTFTGTTFQDIVIDGYETVFYNCNFHNTILIKGSRNKFVNCSFINSTLNAYSTNARLEFNQCQIDNTTINAQINRCTNSNIDYTTFTNLTRCIFNGNKVEDTEITVSGEGQMTGNTIENTKINCSNLFGLLNISKNNINDPLSGASDIIVVDMSGSAYRFLKITNNIFSCNNASGGGSTNSSIKITGNFTGSYGVLEMSNNHFDRGNKAIDNTASGNYKFIVKDNMHKNLSSGLGVTNNGSSLIVLDNIQL